MTVFVFTDFLLAFRVNSFTFTAFGKTPAEPFYLVKKWVKKVKPGFTGFSWI
jgi:hypothetical protein